MRNTLSMRASRPRSTFNRPIHHIFDIVKQHSHSFEVFIDLPCFIALLCVPPEKKLADLCLISALICQNAAWDS